MRNATTPLNRLGWTKLVIFTSLSQLFELTYFLFIGVRARLIFCLLVQWIVVFKYMQKENASCCDYTVLDNYELFKLQIVYKLKLVIVLFSTVRYVIKTRLDALLSYLNLV